MVEADGTVGATVSLHVAQGAVGVAHVDEGVRNGRLKVQSQLYIGHYVQIVRSRRFRG